MPQVGEIEIQRRYYAATAEQYESMHVSERDEHSFALSFLVGILDYLEINSVLDVGSGTGRAISFLKQRRPGLRIVGVEPVAALREVGHRQGMAADELIDGDATRLPFKDGEFDLVTEFAVLHHIKTPELAVKEMIRVARRAVFISDSNNFGQGSWPVRAVKQAFNAVGLWRAADFIKTRGKGYTISEGDGLAYSYSMFDNFGLLERHCKSVHVINITGTGINPYRSAPHAAMLGIKK